VLIGATKTDWTAYPKKSLLGSADTRKALHEFLKFGKAARFRKPDESWNEFIFEAYHHQSALHTNSAAGPNKCAGGGIIVQGLFPGD
jgi:hypothetical protein